MRTKPMAILWCALALCAIAGIFLLGQRFPPAPAEGEAVLDALRAEYYQKGTYKDAQLPQLVFLKSRNAGLTNDVKGYFVEDTVYFVFPPGATLTSLVCSYTSADGSALYFGGKRVVSGFTRLDITAQAPAFTLGTRQIAVTARSTTLPVLAIDTYENAPVYTVAQFVPGQASLMDETGVLLASFPASFRVRGNLTATLPKLPYKMKGTDERSLLGLPAASEWTLLANFADPTLLRNGIGYDMARSLGLPYTPNQRHVEVYMRGEYQGVYALGPQMELSAAGVNLAPLHEEGGQWQGSYILEIDERSRGLEECYVSAYNIPLVFKDPKKPNKKERAEALSDVERFEACLQSEDFTAGGLHYTNCIDADSFAKYLLITEAIKNTDTMYPLSVYLYRDETGRLAMGPVWDMDLAFGNNSEGAPQGFITEKGLWFGRLLEDPAFKQRVLAQYKALAPYYKTLPAYLQAYKQQMQTAANNNFIATYIGVNDYSNIPQDDPFLEEMQRLESWIFTRKAWLDENIQHIGSY